MAVYRSSRREQRSRESRADILNAAIRILADRGLGSATIRNVAQEAGISQGSIYHFFDSREGLIEAVVLELRARIEQPIADAIAAAGPDHKKRVIAAIDTTIEYAIKDPQAFRAINVLQTDSTLMPVVLRALAAKPGSLGEAFRLGYEVYGAAVRNGAIKRVSWSCFVDYLNGAIQGAIIRAGVHGPDYDSRPLFKMVRDGALAVLGIDGN